MKKDLYFYVDWDNISEDVIRVGKDCFDNIIGCPSHQYFVIVEYDKGPLCFYETLPENGLVIGVKVENGYWSQMLYQFLHEYSHAFMRGETKRMQKDRWHGEIYCQFFTFIVMTEIGKKWQREGFCGRTTNGDKVLQYVTDIIENSSQLLQGQAFAKWFVSEKTQHELTLKTMNYKYYNIIASHLFSLYQREPALLNDVIGMRNVTGDKFGIQANNLIARII